MNDKPQRRVSAYKITAIRRAVSRLVQAEVAKANIGAHPPEDYAEIEEELRDAIRQYDQAMAALRGSTV